jgi:hypothetical protein
MPLNGWTPDQIINALGGREMATVLDNAINSLLARAVLAPGLVEQPPFADQHFAGLGPRFLPQNSLVAAFTHMVNRLHYLVLAKIPSTLKSPVAMQITGTAIAKFFVRTIPEPKPEVHGAILLEGYTLTHPNHELTIIARDFLERITTAANNPSNIPVINAVERIPEANGGGWNLTVDITVPFFTVIQYIMIRNEPAVVVSPYIHNPL